MVESEGNSSRSHEFFKVYLSEFSSKKLGLPPAFVHQLQGNKPTNCTIKDPTGKLWHVKLEKAEGNLIIANGWQDFAKFHSLVDGDFLIFEYDGSSHFGVKIYGKNGLRKRKNPNTDACGVQVKKERQKEKEATGQRFSPPTRPRPPGLRPDKGYKMTNLGVHPQRFQPFSGKSTCNPSNSSIKKQEERRPVGIKKEEHISPLVKTFDPPKNPHFATIITQSTRYTVYIPKPLIEGKKIKIQNNVTLRNDDGKFWPVEVHCRKDGRFHLSKGWVDFWKDNKLVTGDMCIFEFVPFKDNVSSILLVHIVRKGTQTKKPVHSKSEEVSDVGPNFVILDD